MGGWHTEIWKKRYRKLEADSLRLREVGMLESKPQTILANGTDRRPSTSSRRS